jgi:hypothetical protein
MMHDVLLRFFRLRDRRLVNEYRRLGLEDRYPRRRMIPGLLRWLLWSAAGVAIVAGIFRIAAGR